jgi:hypothetical protein
LGLEALEDRLALSPFMVKDNILVVTGTPGNDYFTYSYNPSTYTAVLTLNGASYTVNEDQVFLHGISFDGQGGNDTAVLSAAKDALEVDLQPGTGHLVEGGLAAEVDVSNTENIYAYGNSATRAYLRGPGSFTGTPTASYEYGTGFYDLVSGGVGYVYADPSGNASAAAYLYGSPAGGDRFSSDGFTNTYTFANGNTLDVRAFSHVYANAGQYGTGSVTFTDSTGHATLNAGPEHASFVAPYGPTIGTFTIEADGFRQLSAAAQSATGADTAVFTGAGNDVFSGGKGSAAMSGPGYYLSAAGFSYVTAYGTGDQSELASLFDSPGDDTFAASPDYAEMSGAGYEVTVYGFKNAYGFRFAGGHDSAYLYDSPGNDTLTAGPTSATLTGAGFDLEAYGFATLHAFAFAGGHDTASLTGGPGANTFNAQYNRGYLTGSGFAIYVTNFAAVDLFSAPGGTGIAYTDYSTVNYLLTLHPGWSRGNGTL